PVPYLATMPSCMLYLRPVPSTSYPTTITSLLDWSPKHRAMTVNGTVKNAQPPSTIFPPCSMLFDGSTGYLTAENSADFNVSNYNFALSCWFELSSPQITAAWGIFAPNTINGGYWAAFGA